MEEFRVYTLFLIDFGSLKDKIDKLIDCFVIAAFIYKTPDNPLLSKSTALRGRELELRSEVSKIPVQWEFKLEPFTFADSKFSVLNQCTSSSEILDLFPGRESLRSLCVPNCSAC